MSKVEAAPEAKGIQPAKEGRKRHDMALGPEPPAGNKNE
jgi:hypothetical protein